jgi:DNA-binding MarR family transcriptional regulator
MPRPRRKLTDDDFERLLGFRDGLRRFLHWSEEQARAVGLTPAQHQLLLAIRGRPEPPSITEIAEHLMLRHHSTVELVARAERAGLIVRRADQGDQRVVRLSLTPLGESKLVELSAAHLEELSRVRTQLSSLWEQLPIS